MNTSVFVLFFLYQCTAVELLKVTLEKCHLQLRFSQITHITFYEFAEWLNMRAVYFFSKFWVCLWDWQVSRVQLKRDGTRWRTGGKWRGNWRMKWIASTLHTTSEHGVSSITTADAHTSAASSRLNWHPCRFKWTRPFRQKTKSDFRACAIAFQKQSTTGHLVAVVTTANKCVRYLTT
jgi:hypothetical protein